MTIQRPTATVSPQSHHVANDTPRLHVLRRTMNNTTRGGMFALAALLSTTSFGFADPGLTELPTGGNVQAGNGSATFDYGTPNHLEVTQTTGRAIIDWNSFNIGQNASTHINQTQGGNSISVNRVHSGQPSQIFGSLTSNGNVIVLNQNGVFFGNSSKVDVAGLLVSTGEIDANAFNANGAVKLSNINANPAAKITNKGSISVKDGGLAAFVAPNIVNDGVITANLGRVAIAGGADKATVDLYGDGLVELALDDKASKALIDNNGTIKADGGTVAITVAAAVDVVNSVINMGGVVEANSVGTKNGKIILGATNADINITGKINAKGGKGVVKATTTKNITVAPTAEINADAGQNGNGGTIELIAHGVNTFHGYAFARGGAESGNGGFVEVSGYDGLDYQGLADLTAANGSLGNLLLDPRFTIIHSGIVLPGIFQQYVLSSTVLATQLRFGNVTLQADEFIDVGAKGPGGYNISTGNFFSDIALNAFLNTLPAGDINVSSALFGTTTGSLTLKSDVVNVNRDLTMGRGDVTIDANTANLNARMYGKYGNATQLLDDNRLKGLSNLATINVKSANASINQALYLSDNDTALTTINVAAGTYNEQVKANKSNVLLKGANAGKTGSDATRGVETVIKNNISGSAGLSVSADDVTVDGFKISNTGGDAVNLYDADNVTFINNALTSLKYGVNVYNVTNTKVAHNKISDVLTGIYASKGENNSFNDNVIYNTASHALTVIGNSAARIDGNAIGYTDIAGTVSGSAGNIKGNGIQLVNSADAQINLNRIANATTNGIFVDPSDGTVITGNNVTGGINGIYVLDSSNVIVGGSAANKNTVTGTTGGWGQAGILIENGTNNTVSFNTISDSHGDGVRLQGTSGANVTNNTITDVDQSGIAFKQSASANVNTNTISQTGSNGISFELSDNAKVNGNTISNTFGDGINLYYGNQNAEIGGNTITNARLNGIHLDKTGGNNNAVIGKAGSANTISGATNGIFVEGAKDVTIEANAISNVSQDGIYLTGVTATDAAVPNSIVGNRIIGSGHNGMTIANSANILIGDAGAANANLIDNTGWDGVAIVQSSAVTVRNNDITHVFGASGVATMAGSDNVTIENNRIANTARLGVYAANQNNLKILDNDIANTGLENSGANYLSAIHVEASNGVDVSDNRITGTNGDGINLGSGINTAGGITNVVAARNTLNNVDGHGIVVRNGQTVALTNNIINNVGLNGVYAAGQNNGNVVFNGNDVTSQAGNVGARFESGIIDMRGIANIFTDGAVGLLFDPTVNGNAANLRLVDNTIGQTAFTGQTEYYVELDNGAFFNPGTPTLMNGYNATFDGLQAGTMNIPQYNNLLAMIWDYNDINTVGLFFPRLNGADINDILPEQTFAQSGLFRSPLLTITGLPFAPGARIPVNALTQLNANALNNLASAAGGEQVGESSQRSGQGAQFASLLNSVETSAGETTVGCWGGVYNSLNTQSATPVTYNFNVSPIAQLADQERCGTTIGL